MCDPPKPRIGWQILSANKTGNAERRLNKRGVNDKNVKDYLHFAWRCDVVSKWIWWKMIWQEEKRHWEEEGGCAQQERVVLCVCVCV